MSSVPHFTSNSILHTIYSCLKHDVLPYELVNTSLQVYILHCNWNLFFSLFLHSLSFSLIYPFPFPFFLPFRFPFHLCSFSISFSILLNVPFFTQPFQISMSKQFIFFCASQMYYVSRMTLIMVKPLIVKNYFATLFCFDVTYNFSVANTQFSRKTLGRLIVFFKEI